MRFVDFDPITRVYTHFVYDNDTDQFKVVRTQNTDPITEDNKLATLDVDQHRQQAKNDWAHYAKVPNIVIEKWLNEEGVNFFDPNHWPRVMRLINSPEYRYLKRTTYYHDR